MHTIRGRIATTHVHFNLAVYQVVTITVCEVDGHGWRVVCSWVCLVVVVVFGGGDDVFASCARGTSRMVWVLQFFRACVLSCRTLKRGDCANQCPDDLPL